MEVKQLTDLGVTEEQAGKIIDINKAELSAVNEKHTAAQKELEAAKATVKDISEKLKTYDGVDIEALKKSASDWEKKYNDDMKAAKMNSAVELVLTKAGAKDVSLASILIDKTILKEEDGKLVGLSEQLEKIRTEKAWLFEDGKGERAPVPTVSTGLPHDDPSASSAPATIEGALSEFYK